MNKDRTDLFESPDARALYKTIRETYQQEGRVDAGLLLDRLEDQSLKNQVSGLTIRESMDPEDDKIFLSDLNRRIHLKELQQQEKELYRKIRTKEKSGITEELKTLLAMKKDLLQRRKEILISSKG